MKPRHAAALTLVGWYLMIAPNVPESSGKGPVSYETNAQRNPDVEAPLNLWWRTRAFSTEAECNKEKTKELEPFTTIQAIKGLTPAVRARLAARASLFAKAYVCVSDDDPRLKGN
jgi:hypothetical protein